MNRYATHTTYKGFTNNEEQIGLNLINALLQHTPLTNDLCKEILSYLPLQHQFTKLNPIKYDKTYSIIQLITLLINNIIHYVISILLLQTLNIMIPFTVFTCFETCIILYFYIHFYSHVDNNAIADKIVKFNNLLYTVIEIMVHIPMVIILLFFNTNFALQILFLVSYSIMILYRYFMYIRQSKFLVTTITEINPLIYPCQIIFLIIGYIAFENLAMAIILIYVMTYILYGTYMCHKIRAGYSGSSDCSVRSQFSFVNLLVENICFMAFGIELLFVYSNILSTITLIFVFIATVSILLLHSPLDIYCYINKDKEHRLIVNLLVMEFFIHIPMTIILLYYMYSNHNSQYINSFYAMIAFYFLNATYKFCSFAIYASMDNSKILYAASVLLKLVISVIFGALYWSDIQSGYNSHFLFPVTIVFIVLLSLVFCVPFCCGFSYVLYCIFCVELGDMSG